VHSPFVTITGVSHFAVIAALVFAPLGQVHGQSVISTRSGIVHYFEGSVSVAGQPLERHFGKFPNIPEGAELRTEQGRAEVLLTPGTILRVGQKSAIRMASNALSDTRVELVDGSAIVDSDEFSPGTSVTVLYKGWAVHLLKRGSYRIDSDPPQLWVRRGDAEVTSGPSGLPVAVDSGMTLPFAKVLAAEHTIDPPSDGLTDWAQGRSQSVTADNAISSQISDDPASITDPNAGLDSFTYFPMLGLSSPGVSTASPYGTVSPYGGYGLYQSGFYSMYLPGYAYRPLILVVGPGAYRSSLGIQPLHVSPGLGSGLHPLGSPVPSSAGPRIMPLRPATPVRAVTPVRGGRR
jgi:hypothetical protein